MQGFSAWDKCFFGKNNRTGMKKDITELYSFIDDFCQIYRQQEKKKLLPSLKQRHRSCKMSLGELLTIMLKTSNIFTKPA